MSKCVTAIQTTANGKTVPKNFRGVTMHCPLSGYIVYASNRIAVGMKTLEMKNEIIKLSKTTNLNILSDNEKKAHMAKIQKRVLGKAYGKLEAAP